MTKYSNKKGSITMRIFTLALIFLSAAIGITCISGCGKYIPHEPEQPGIEQPGDPPEEPDIPGTEEPEEPTEGNYVNSSLTICDTVGGTYYFEYTGELNAVHVTAENVPANARIYINQPGKGDYNFAAGTSYKITIQGDAPIEWQCWVGQLQRPIDSFTIENGVAEFTLTMPVTYIFAAIGSSGTIDLDFTLTLQTT